MGTVKAVCENILLDWKSKLQFFFIVNYKYAADPRFSAASRSSHDASTNLTRESDKDVSSSWSDDYKDLRHHADCGRISDVHTPDCVLTCTFTYLGRVALVISSCW